MLPYVVIVVGIGGVLALLVLVPLLLLLCGGCALAVVVLCRGIVLYGCR